jgi:hypothetical protein
MSGPENVCVWDAFGDYTCRKPSKDINAFTTGGTSIEFFADGSVGNAALAKPKPKPSAPAPPAPLAPPAAPIGVGAVGAEGFCGCASVDAM